MEGNVAVSVTKFIIKNRNVFTFEAMKKNLHLNTQDPPK